MFRTRFAPSPTGPLHLGHAYSAILAHDMARANAGAFVLRIEDIDQSRARPEWEEQIYEDLTWLGLSWDEPVMRQSERITVYQTALDELWQRALLFPCTCSRRDISDALAAPQEGVLTYGPDGLIYPGTCRNKPRDGADLPDAKAIRLSMRGALNVLKSIDRLGFDEMLFRGSHFVRLDAEELVSGVGDVVLSRQDMNTSYHLSVVLDDAAQGITDVVRGEDLFDATQIHVVLQGLLGLPTPTYHHHRLIRDEAGKRLAKRDDARAIRTFRDDGATPDDIRRLVGLPPYEDD